jgi:hypothetical protein
MQKPNGSMAADHFSPDMRSATPSAKSGAAAPTGSGSDSDTEMGWDDR